MTLASQLKQKSRSINQDRLKSAANARKIEREKEKKAKKAAQERAQRLAESAARRAEIEIARIVRKKERERKQHEERKRLISWLTPGLLSAWNKEDYIFYHPRSDQESSTAKKFLGYTSRHDDILNLTQELSLLEIETKFLQNHISHLQNHADISLPFISFDINSLLLDFDAKEKFFNRKWRSDLRKSLIRLENSALSNALKVISYINEDRDIFEIKRLADTLRPRIDTFHSQYQSLMSSPSSYFRIQPVASKFESTNYAELTTQREYQLAVARYVLREMNIYCSISSPDIIGKFMAAFRIASGDEFFSALLDHITDPELVNRITGYSELWGNKSNGFSGEQLLSQNWKSIAKLLDSSYASLNRVSKTLTALADKNLIVTQGQVSCSASVQIDHLFETKLSPEVDRLAYDIQWLRSPAGQKFKKQFTEYLNELASDGKYTAKIKVFSENDELLIELPSGKEIACDMDWSSFERLMKLLELQITETTSSGIVKLKWG